MSGATVFFQRIASSEYRKAKDWYGAHSSPVAMNFVNAVDRTVARIEDHPERLPKIGKKYQYIPVKRFPYILIFRSIAAKSFVIVAVAHTKRRPNYWRGR